MGGRITYQRILDAVLKFWTLFIGIGALAGALMMWTDPTGKMLDMEPLLVVLQERMPLPKILFRTFIPSGLALFLFNGLTQFAAFHLLRSRHPSGPCACLACGVILMLWVALEWWLFGFVLICNIYFAFGFLEALTSLLFVRMYGTRD